MGSEHAQRPEVGQLSRCFQSNQPTPIAIRERSGRLDNMQDGRNTSRSQEIDVNSFLRRTQFFRKNGATCCYFNTADAKDSSRVRSSHESDTFNLEDEELRKRIEKSIAGHDESHESMMVNEADMDFRIPGLPHSVVKHAQSTSVRQLIEKIENHPDRLALQQDLRQNQSFNPFSPESKQMIQDVGIIELCELLETEPKTQCTVCLSYWNIGFLYCTCGHFLHEERGDNQQFISFSMDLLHSLSTSSRKEDLMDIDMVKNRETRNTLRLTN